MSWEVIFTEVCGSISICQFINFDPAASLSLSLINCFGCLSLIPRRDQFCIPPCFTYLFLKNLDIDLLFAGKPLLHSAPCFNGNIHKINRISFGTSWGKSTARSRFCYSQSNNNWRPLLFHCSSCFRLQSRELLPLIQRSVYNVISQLWSLFSSSSFSAEYCVWISMKPLVHKEAT